MSDSILLEDDNYYDELSPELINFPPDVQSAIEQVIPSDDPLDEPNFNPVDYINSIFPTEQSLSNLDDVVNKMEFKIRVIDSEIRAVVRGQSNAGTDGREALEEAQQVIRMLFNQISDIKCKAEVSEETVREITRDIKQLDTAKRNLTAAIKTLNHLHMMVGGVDSLKSLTMKRQYGDIVRPLQAITEVMSHFNKYIDIPQIKELSDQVHEIQDLLAEQITQEFHDSLAGPNSKNFVPNRQLAEACLVVSILDPKIKRELLKWFVEVQLSEYLVLFHESEDVAWLDKLDRRYAWFKKHLLQCEDKFGPMFPSDWDVSEHITVEFCNLTKSELSKIMSKRRSEIDVKLLLYAIQRTVNLESLLAKRFSGRTLTEDPDTQSPFTGLISDVFQPYLYIYIESLDKNLLELIERMIADANNDFSKELGLPGSTVSVLPSCADLFVFYKKCLIQCTGLSNGLPMLHLCNTFQKYLKMYASRVLQSNLPKLGTGPNLTRDLRDLSTAAGLIQNFLKEDSTRFNRQELARICCVLTTAEYCLETTQQLQEKLKEKIESSLSDSINLSAEQDTFHTLISNCIGLLVQDLEVACDPALTAMSKISWSNVESVGDQSAYVSAITSHLKTTIPNLRDYLAATRKYFTQFCVKFVNSFIPKYIQTIYKCKPVSTHGAEQLLLDAHMLKTTLIDLPSIGSQVTRKAPASFTKVVTKGMSRAEMILKVVMTQPEPYSDFVDQYVKLLPDSDLTEFQKVLDMKALKSQDKHHLVAVFKRRHPSSAPPPGQTLSSPKHETTNIRKLNNLIKKF